MNLPMIDAEESWIQDAIDNITEEMMIIYNRDRCVVMNTIQLYRHDRLQFLKNSFKRLSVNNIICGYKLVRGAYMEKERKRALQNNYLSPIALSIIVLINVVFARQYSMPSVCCVASTCLSAA